MLTTSVSLPVTFASLWRVRQHEVMRLATRTLRIQFSRQPPRRGVTRMYNRGCGGFQHCDDEITEAEYDTLHSAARCVSCQCIMVGLLYNSNVAKTEPSEARESIFD
jgi:hypothetical protein